MTHEILRMRYLYKITNLVNEKNYIGQTIDPIRRWYQHRRDAANPKYAIQHSIKKYGAHNFAFEIIAVCKTLEDSNFLEEELIKQYNCLVDSGKGYNINLGGNVAPKSESWKIRSSNSMKKIWSQYSVDKRLKIANAIKEYWKNNSDKHYEISSEQREKMIAGLQKTFSNPNYVSPHKGVRASPETEFKPGHNTWNKNLKGIHLSPKSEFKPGQRVSPATEFKKGTNFQVWNRKLTEAQEKEIKEKYLLGQSQRSLAREYNIDRSSIKRVIK